MRFALGTRTSQGSPTSVQMYHSPFPPASFSLGSWTDPNNSSFLTPFTALPTYVARILFAEMRKVRGRRERACSEDCHLLEATALPGGRTQGRDGMGRGCWSPPPSPALLLGGQGDAFLGGAIPERLPPAKKSPSQGLVLRPSCWGPNCHLGRMVLKIKCMISWVLCGVAALPMKDPHNIGTAVFSASQVLLFLQRAEHSLRP